MKKNNLITVGYDEKIDLIIKKMNIDFLKQELKEAQEKSNFLKNLNIPKADKNAITVKSTKSFNS